MVMLFSFPHPQLADIRRGEPTSRSGAFKKHPDRLVGTFGDEDRVAGFDVDGLPRLVQIQAEGFLHNESFH